MRQLGIFFSVILLSLVMSAPPGVAQTTLVFVSFTTLDCPGATGTYASGINNTGTSTGTSLSQGSAQDDEENEDKDEKDEDASGSAPAGGSASGLEQYVGNYFDISGTHGYSRAGLSCTQIDYAGTTGGTSALGVNSLGQIVGYSGRHGFLRDAAGVFTSIDYPSANCLGCGTAAAGISNLGQIVGWYSVSGQTHGFLRDATGVFSSIDYPGAAATLASGINNLGQIVGWYFDFPTWKIHGFLRDAGGTFTSIDYPGAICLGCGTGAAGINNLGQIVGWYSVSGRTHGFLRDAAGIFTTIDYVGAPFWLEARGINDLGKIVGWYYDFPTWNIHGFAATH